MKANAHHSAPELRSEQRPLRILHLEDNAKDRELVCASLMSHGFRFDLTHAKDRTEFEAALSQAPFDLILSDYNLPSFDGSAALRLVRERQPETAFIFVSGTIGEERAVEGMKAGATDYVMKEHLDRLGLVVQRAMRELTAGKERRRAEEALRQSEERFREVVENIHEVFWMTDVGKSQMLYVSPGYEKIWGCSCESLYASPSAWLESIHEPDRDRVVKAARSQGIDGLYDETYRIVRPDGTLRWVRDRAFPIRESDGDVRRVVGIAEDITERKQFEEQLLRSQRMESIGTLAGGIAHDLNNVLTPIMVGVDLLKCGGIDEAHRPMVELMGRSAQRGANLVQQVLSFARGVEGARVAVHLGHLLREVHEFVRSTFPKNIYFRPTVPRDTWLVPGDPTQLLQVLLNLCVNARDAMPDGGAITVAVRNLDIDEQYAASLKAVPAGRYVQVEVTDTGKGIPREWHDRIFEPFFTSKEAGKGTGLGLSTALGIVRNHGGSISVNSELRRGSTFTVLLPAQPESIEVIAIASVTESIQRGRGETILVVDDDPTVLAATVRTLETFGYRVVGAQNGAEAVALYVVRRDEIALVLTDLMMPVMDGPSLINALQGINPGVKHISTSGFQGKAGIDGARHFLAKPFKALALLKLVRESLDEKSEGTPSTERSPTGRDTLRG